MLVGSDHCYANSQTNNFAMPSVLLIIRMAFGKVMWRRCVIASINLHDYQAELSGGEAESVGARMRKFNITAFETIETRFLKRLLQECGQTQKEELKWQKRKVQGAQA